MGREDVVGFRALYRVLTGEARELAPEELKEALRSASLNKVLLQFMRELDLQGSIREREEKRLRLFLAGVQEVSKRLEGLNYAFFKIVKPVAYVPSDIDVLIDWGDLASALSRLRESGYEVVVVEPYSVTLSSGESVLDLYVHPTLGGIIYLDGGGLLRSKREVEFNGITIPALDPSAEALVTAAHAIFKERLYTLNDYFVLDKMSSPATLRLAEKCKCVDSLEYAFRLNSRVEEGSLILPYRIPLPVWLKIIGSKIKKDPLTRGSSLNMVRFIRGREIGRHVMSKLTRKTY